MASIKWNLWHGKSAEALEKIGEIDDCVIMHEEDNMVEKRYKKLKAFEDYVREFYTYISNNQGFIINYCERHRYGETITTSFVESTVNICYIKKIFQKAVHAVDQKRNSFASSSQNEGIK